MSNREISLMVARYDRTQAFFSGEVSLEGIDLKVFPPPSQGAACYRPVYEMFDVVEMSLSWYVMARARGEPLIALPIFPLRMFIQPYVYCSASSTVKKPEDLREKRVGMEQYRFTVGLWARGILKEHHGVGPSDISWVTSDAEGAGYRFPSNVNVQVQDRDVESLLLNGELDAIIAANVPRSYRAGDSRIRRIFSDCRLAVQEYFEKTRIFPITHTLVMKESLLTTCPWLVGRLVAAFDEADRLCRHRYQYPKRFSFPTAVLFMEEEEQRFGQSPWRHGLEPNRHILEKFIEYAEDQGYISFRPRVDDLFVVPGSTAGLIQSESARVVSIPE
jgi:4,5-dihydroxyphthalate decarboxylase